MADAPRAVRERANSCVCVAVYVRFAQIVQGVAKSQGTWARLGRKVEGRPRCSSAAEGVKYTAQSLTLFYRQSLPTCHMALHWLLYDLGCTHTGSVPL